MGLSRLFGDLLVTGNLRSKTLTIPAGTIKDIDISASAALSAAKLQHQHAVGYKQDDGSDIVAAIAAVFVVRGGTATITDIDVVALTAPTGGDKAFTVDLKKANQGAPTPASVLSSPISYSSSQADCEVEPGTVSSAALVDGDVLVVVVAVSGSSGSQGQGLAVTVTVREDGD